MSRDLDGKYGQDINAVYDRSSSEKEFKEYMATLWKHQQLAKGSRSNDKADYPLFLLSGGSGTGKTFLLDVIALKCARELLTPHGAEGDYVAIPITFNSGREEMKCEQDWDAETKLTVRALYSLFERALNINFGVFVKFVFDNVQLPLALDVPILYCRKYHQKKIVIFLVDELYRLYCKEPNGEAQLKAALTALGRVSQDYIQESDTLVMSVLSSLVQGEVMTFETESHRPILRCGLPLLSPSTVDSIFSGYDFSDCASFVSLKATTSGHPRSVSNLMISLKQWNIHSETELQSNYGKILETLEPKVLPDNYELLLAILLFCLKVRDGIVTEHTIIVGSYTVKHAHLAGILFWQHNHPLMIHIGVLRKFAQEHQETFLGSVLLQLFNTDASAAGPNIQPLDFEWLTLYREVLFRYAQQDSSSVALSTLYSRKAWISDNMKGWMLQITKDEKQAMKTPLSEVIHEFSNTLKSLATTRLPTKLFLKPNKQNFLGVDYFHRWKTQCGKEIVFAIQNKFQHVVPSLLKTYTPRMNEAITTLKMSNPTLTFIPVYITLTETSREKANDCLDTLKSQHPEGYIFLNRDATLSFLYPLHNMHLLLRKPSHSVQQKNK